MFKVSPSLLACDFSNMGEEIIKVSKSGADYVHLDVMDGHFVPNISFGPGIIKSLRNKTKIPFDVHLMISNPLDYIEKFAAAGADIITIHEESNGNTAEALKKIKSLGVKAGLAIKPKTPAESALPYLENLDLLLVMTVEPGFGGQKFMKDQMEKTKFLKEKITNKNLPTLIEIDGGVNLESISLIKDYPVDILVSGTCIFNSPDCAETIRLLKS